MTSVSPTKFIKRAVFNTRELSKRFGEEVAGVAAIEFAFLAPLMLLMYVGTIEVSSAVSANRKLSRVSSTVGDLITQLDVADYAGNCIPATELIDIVKIADDIMFPYSHTLSIVISGITITGAAAKVSWSVAYEGVRTDTAVSWSEAPESREEVDSVYSLPSQIAGSDGFIVAAESSISYTPLFGFAHITKADGLYFETTAIPMNEVLYLRPRIGTDLTTCP